MVKTVYFDVDARILLTYQSNARLFSLPAVECSKVHNFRFAVFENVVGSFVII